MNARGPTRAGVALIAALVHLPGPSMTADELRALWDFARPEVSEARFRARAATATGDEQAILQTQIARTYGLRRRFDEARAELAAIEPRLPGLGAEARARWQLEWGRTWVSATHRDDEMTDAARETARRAYLDAVAIARGAGLDGLAVDALHMLAFVERDPAAALGWNERALALATSSADPSAVRWESALRHNAGLALHQAGRLDEALAMFEANVAVNERSGDLVRTRIAWWSVAWTLRGLGRVDEALAIQLRLERENDAAGTPDEYVFEELAALHAARGDDVRASQYRARQAAAKAAAR